MFGVNKYGNKPNKRSATNYAASPRLSRNSHVRPTQQANNGDYKTQELAPRFLAVLTGYDPFFNFNPM